MGILAASEQLPPVDLAQYEFAGELALSGELRAIVGEIPVAMASSQSKRTLIIPIQNTEQASWVKQAKILAISHLTQLFSHFAGQQVLPLVTEKIMAEELTEQEQELDMRDVMGQPLAKRALEIAASGGHNLLFIGPPGTGKTMLASRLAGILPPMTETEALQVAAIQSISHQGITRKSWFTRPFRAPHHTASSAALVGGGSQPKLTVTTL